MNRILASVSVLGLLTLIGYLLMAGRAILLPLLIAVVIWYLIVSTTQVITHYASRFFVLPFSIALTISIFLCLFLLYGVFNLLTNNIAEVVNAAPFYQDKLIRLLNTGFQWVGVEHPPSFSEVLSKHSFVSTFTRLAGMVTEIVSSTGIIMIYVLFLLIDYRTFDTKLAAIVKDNKRLSHARDIIDTIATKIQHYIKLKTFLSLLTACTSYVVLFLVGVDFAAFWALLIFLLNYIPTIGSIIATLFPCLLAIVQFESLSVFFEVAAALIIIQFTIGSVLEPKLMGKSFNLSGLVLILSLSFWGQIWGVVGMFLCVPIMVIAMIILSAFPTTRPIAILLSADGKI